MQSVARQHTSLPLAVLLTAFLVLCSPGCGLSLSKPKQNYVLTSIVGRPPAAPLHVFIRSWKRYSPDARVVVFTDGAFPEGYLLEVGADEVHARIPSGTSVARFLLERFFYAAGFVEERGGEQSVGLVAVCDMSDVAVQADPFAAPPVTALLDTRPTVLFMMEGNAREPAPMSDANRPLNGQWYEQCFGTAALRAIARERVSCAGLLIANAGGLVAYGRAMRHLADNVVNASCLDVQGSDQGMHNHLLHAMAPVGKLGFDAVQSFNGQVVHNVVYTYKEVPRLNLLGQWVRPEEDGGGVIPLLHQFKYRAAVNSLIEGMYPIVDTWRIY